MHTALRNGDPKICFQGPFRIHSSLFLELDGEREKESEGESESDEVSLFPKALEATSQGEWFQMVAWRDGKLVVRDLFVLGLAMVHSCEADPSLLAKRACSHTAF